MRRRYDLPFYSHCLHSLPLPFSLPTVCSPYVWSRTRRDWLAHRWSRHRTLKSSVWKHKPAISHWTRWFSPRSDIFFFPHRCLLSGPSSLSLFMVIIKTLEHWESYWKTLTLTASRAAREERNIRTGFKRDSFTSSTNCNEGQIAVWAISRINTGQNISIATQIDHGSVRLSSLNTDCLFAEWNSLPVIKYEHRDLFWTQTWRIWHCEPTVCGRYP